MSRSQWQEERAYWSPQRFQYILENWERGADDFIREAAQVCDVPEEHVREWAQGKRKPKGAARELMAHFGSFLSPWAKRLLAAINDSPDEDATIAAMAEACLVPNVQISLWVVGQGAPTERQKAVLKKFGVKP